MGGNDHAHERISRGKSEFNGAFASFDTFFTFVDIACKRTQRCEGR